MNFMEAVKAIKEGKKVRRKEWRNKEYYWHRGKIQDDFEATENLTDLSYIKDKDGNNVCFLTDWVLATDWEIFEEKKQQMVCKKCGTVDESWTAYCGKCGRSIHTIEEKDTWNLAEQDGVPKSTNTCIDSTYWRNIKDIKTFIQKVNGDIDNCFLDKELRNDVEKTIKITCKAILKNRAGDLK